MTHASHTRPETHADQGPTELLRKLEASGLRGRGGGWFPAARKWRAVAVEDGAPFVVANGAEGEPGSIKDRHVMTTRPEDVVHGLLWAARALHAREAAIYLKGSFKAPAAALQQALDRVAGNEVAIRLVRGEESFVAGEETAILESLEGRRAWPRPKPPLPAGVGFQGRPTLVQNVETLSRVSAALSDPSGYRSSESTLVSLWGHVRRPGVYEVPLGTPLDRVIDECGQGAPEGIGLIFPASSSAPPLLPEQAAVPLDPDALRAAGSALGAAAVLVVKAAACPLGVAASLARFAQRESCGQCPPCSVGTGRLAEILAEFAAGTARTAHLRALHEVAGFMGQHGYCAHSSTAASALTGLVERVPEAVEQHLRAGRCPAGEEICAPFDPGSPELRAIEACLS